ncbi:MAG: hypothetical protein NC111_00980 [Bacteroides sp.]|nr:hypothetical protein [Bacteroides sp.]MCM1413538.1 hypothetical protein [Bacteroides sp.]MCM1471092.1 hypothetical protein [Bacteroides sp.]
MKKLLRPLIVAIVSMITISGFSQANSRQYIRESIKGWGECRNVAITKRNGDVALYGSTGSGYSCSDVPIGLKNALKQLHDDDQYIDDVQLTDNGSWLVLYGKNGMRWYGVPEDLESYLYKANNDDETITSVTFNDAGDWIMISDEYIRASSDALRDWISEGMEDLGKVYAACVTDDAVVVVFEEGFRYYGNIPDGLKKALNDTNIDIYRLKVSGSSWFFADRTGKRYNYHM